jgi:hypothetical protein
MELSGPVQVSTAIAVRCNENKQTVEFYITELSSRRSSIIHPLLH